jgi:phospho-N-acetylmuramoyl-pentapeptide-transferase
MLYRLIQAFQDDLEQGPLGFLRVLLFPEFAALLASVGAFFAVLLLGGPTIRWLRRQKIGDNPDFDDASMNAAMAAKGGTPTMGGLLIVAAIGGTTLLLADIGNFYIVMSLVCLVWLGGIGAADDWLKLTAARRQGGRQGLTGREKLALQIGLALIIGFFAWRHGQELPDASSLYVPFLKGVVIPLNLPVFLIISVAVIVGSSNAVNLTDGLDGLATGCVALVSIVFLVLTLIISDGRLAEYLLFHHVRQIAPVAVVCGAMLGASLGFLWFNCFPARVFMGDTGSLALGGLIGYVALVTRQELILFLVGGIFVAEAMSVMLQVGYFKYTRRRYGQGRRIFLMSPLHHHFQKKGWTETQTVVRFWLVGAMLAILALATIKLR